MIAKFKSSKGRQNVTLEQTRRKAHMFRIVTRKRVNKARCKTWYGLALGKQSLKVYLGKLAVYVFHQKGRKRLWSNHGTGNKVAFSR